MVTSVNASALAALLAQEQAQANRNSAAASTSSTTDAVGGQAQSQDPAVVYAGSVDAASISAILSTQSSLNQAASLSDAGIAAGQTIANLLDSLKAKVAQAQASSDTSDASALNDQYQQVLQAIDQAASSATVNGENLIDGSATGEVSSDPMLSLTGQDFTSSGLGLAGTSLLGSSDDLSALMDQLGAAGDSLSTQLDQMTGQSDQIQAQLGVLSQFQSSLSGASDSGDLSADAASLQALSVAQDLSGQGSSVANQAPSALLSLFRTS